jgi:aminoglycoside phosphotransferase (APT) family kinase protein
LETIMTISSVPPGIGSLSRLETWLAINVADAPVSVTDIRLITGGRSNLTYRLSITTEPSSTTGPSGVTEPSGTASGTAGPVPGRQLVLRRPPLGHVLPTAHDMSREFRVLSALSRTPVPVANPVAYCADAEVIGAPFYIMDYVPGQVIRSRADAAVLTPAQAGEVSEDLADMLAAIHGVDVSAVGLGDLGRGAGYLRRQLDRGQRQWQLSATREVPGYESLVTRLSAELPAEGETTLVHGDFRIDNVLLALSPRPRIEAVVDWEMATLGDPLADLGLTLVYWTDRGEGSWLNPTGGEAHGVATDATTSPGFMTRAEFAAGYASRTGRDISNIGYYMAFGYFKLAAVMEGIYARFLQNKTVGDGFDNEGRAVPLLIARAHEVLQGLA